MIITDRYKEKDMSARDMIEKEIGDWAERLDGADIFTVIRILQDWDDSLTLESSVITDLIDATQSNPAASTDALREMIRLDEVLLEMEV